MNDDDRAEIAGAVRGAVLADVPMAPMCSYRVGGAAALVVEPLDEEDLQRLLVRCRRRSLQVLVVGGGHNGMVAAAYLARSGIDVLVVEARSEVGGCASTVDDLGARFNVCHCTHTLIRALPLDEELDLAAHGLSYVSAEADAVFAFHDDRDPWVLFHDGERTIDGLATTHPGSLDGYRRYLDEALPAARMLLDVLRTPPTAPRLAATAARRRMVGLGRLMRWSRQSAADVLGRFFDDWRLAMPATSIGPTVWGVPPDTPGTGLAALAYAIRHLVRSGRPVGGSGALVAALRGSFEAAGGRVLCDARVANLVLDGDRVDGVRLVDGTRLRAPVVLAACDPTVVLAEWLDGEVPAGIAPLVADHRARPRPEGYESKVDAVLDGVPVPRAADALHAALPDFDPAGQLTVVSSDPDDLAEAHRRRADGLVADRPTLLVDVPSHVDPTMAPGPGRHVLSLEVLFTPYAHPGGWEGSTEPDRWLDLWADRMEPGARSLVSDWRAMTPDRYRDEFLLDLGHSPAWAGTPLDAFLGRSPETTRYRTALDGLYLTGAGTYPGAGIVGASGRNAARTVLVGLGAAR